MSVRRKVAITGCVLAAFTLHFLYCTRAGYRLLHDLYDSAHHPEPWDYLGNKLCNDAISGVYPGPDVLLWLGLILPGILFAAGGVLLWWPCRRFSAT